MGLLVHPHVRGDYGSVLVATISIFGSPPRAWGLPGKLTIGVGRNRFTPTCVGTTSVLFRLQFTLSVHPHVRGDYAPKSSLVSSTSGSPPRAWGLRNHLGRVG